MASNRIKNQHLLWRAGFGPMAENSASLENFSTEKLWEVLIQTSAKKPQKIEVARSLSDGLVKGVGEIIRMEKPADEKKAIKKAPPGKQGRHCKLKPYVARYHD